MKNMTFSKKIILLISALAILVIGMYILNSLNTMYDIGLICISNKITGLYCSGCGMTRAVFSLLNLDFYQAFRYNIFSILLLPVLILYFFGAIYAWLFNKANFIARKIPQAFWIVMVILMLIYGVIRNFPMFSYLAPTIV